MPLVIRPRQNLLVADMDTENAASGTPDMVHGLVTSYSWTSWILIDVGSCLMAISEFFSVSAVYMGIMVLRFSAGNG